MRVIKAQRIAEDKLLIRVLVPKHGKHVGQEGTPEGGSKPGYTHAPGSIGGGGGVAAETTGEVLPIFESQGLERFSIEDQQKAVDLAEEKLQEAQGIEPEITSLLEEIGSRTGGELAGLEFRLKGKASMARKILTGMEQDDISLEEAKNDINDAIRYTFLFDPDEYFDKVSSTQRELMDQGWSQYNSKWKNYFQSGDGYDGYNTVMVNEQGQRFEVQFHTPESIEIKFEVHKQYEEFRTLPEGDPRRKQLLESMIVQWEEYEKPKSWEKLPGVLIQ
ncbi:MAG: hypothetical protein ACW99J_17635 [Candidatus Thorarchaeota archaeon]|jgi:hypothetical protein